MKINFIGGFFAEQKLKDYLKNSKGIFQFAADSFQKSIIIGLKENQISLSLFSVPFLPNFPNYKYFFAKSSKNVSFRDITIVETSYLNLKFFDSFSKSYSLKNIFQKKIPNTESEVILIYGMFDYFLSAIPSNRKNKICLIVPDIPKMMGGDMTSWFTRLYLYLIEFNINRNLHKIDCFVLISDFMKKKIPLENRPYIVIEGIYNDQNLIANQPKESKITLFYSGTLAIRYGILDLMEAFNQIKNQNYVLWICGDGDGKEQVQKAADTDTRIKYFGQLPNEDVQILQRKATILVNPRKNDEEFTKYSFPSKTMEYLASGTPTIMYRLDGVPAEYYDYCFVPEEQSVKGLKDEIIAVAELTNQQREEFGQKARGFILKNKTPAVQTKKMIEMLKKI